jgi:hypothetical protein
MENLMKKGAGYYKFIASELIKACIKVNNRPVTARVVTSIIESADHKFNTEKTPKGRMAEVRQLLFQMMGSNVLVESVKNEEKIKLDDKGKRVYNNKLFYISQKNEKRAYQNIDHYFVIKNAQLKKSIDIRRKLGAKMPGLVATKPAPTTTGLSLTEDQKNYNEYLRKKAIELMKGESNSDFPTAFALVKEEYGDKELKISDLRNLVEILAKAECHNNKVPTAEVTKYFDSYDNFESFITKIEKFGVKANVELVNKSKSGRGRKPIQIDEPKAIMNSVINLAHDIYGKFIQVPVVSSKKAEPVKVITSTNVDHKEMEPETIIKGKQEFLTDLEKRVIFYTIGMIRTNRCEIDDILKILRNNTFNKIVINKSEFRTIMAKVKNYINIYGVRVVLGDASSNAIDKFMNDINPDMTRNKYMIISASGLTSKDIPFTSHLEYEFENIRAWRFEASKDFHDFKKLAEFIKILRPRLDRLVALDDDRIITALKLHNDVVREREYKTMLANDFGYIADKKLWDIEELYK